MTRPLHSATRAELDSQIITPVWIIRLDIKDDPVYVWTGLGARTFPGSGDAALEGLTFEGIANVGDIGAVTDAKEGSSSLRLALPGVDITDLALRQVVFDERTWQFRGAWIWVALLSASGTVIGQPVRIKKGRMDNMTHEEDAASGEGTLSVEIESHQAYAGEALNTRWSEQPEVDPTDTSQDYVWALANQSPVLGAAQTRASGPSPGGYVDLGGSGSGGSSRNLQRF